MIPLQAIQKNYILRGAGSEKRKTRKRMSLAGRSQVPSDWHPLGESNPSFQDENLMS